MERGYSRGKRTALPTIAKLRQPKDQEAQLLEEVRKIDCILKTDNLKNIHGFIFTKEVKNRLPQDLLNCIHKKHRLISCGFPFMQEQTETNPRSSINPELSFKKKLEAMSVQKIHFFDQERTRHFSQMDHMKWKVAVTNSKTSHKQEKPLNLSTSIHTPIPTPPVSKLEQQSGTTSKRLKRTNKTNQKMVTEIQEHLPQKQLTLQRIEGILRRVKGKVVTIWLPPKSYPQFYGVLVPSIATTKNSVVKCRIKKYILFKQSISVRVFEGILDYLTDLFNIYIERLQLIVSRDDFRGYFQHIGCKIQSWEGVDKISVSYSRQLNP